MKTGFSKRMSRIQVQEKFKKNFQALCAQCPQLARNHETLDDSLTSLQWLWNLNVNISNPTNSKGGKIQRSISSSLPHFPRNLLKGIEDGGAEPGYVSPAGTTKSNLDDKNCAVQPASHLNAAKATIQATSETSRGYQKNGRRSAQVFSRPSPLTLRQSEKPTRCQISATKSHKPGMLSNDRASNAELKLELTDLLPASKLNKLEDETGSEQASARHYSFSPREAMLDLLPGQVDYKNNPYVKPTFSFTTLIYMAIQSSKSRRVSLSGVCKWITDNFMYYRYADPGWQDSVKVNLTQSKYFRKVQKKKDSFSSSWEINPENNLNLRDVTSPLLNGRLQDTSPRLQSTENDFSPNDGLSIASISKSTDNEDPFFLCGRKRKQASPQKLIRRRNAGVKRRRAKSSRHQNLLQEEAPELGSLKGDFNWNSVFDEFFGTNDTQLSVTPTSLPSRSSTREVSYATGRYSDDVVSGSLLAHDMLLLPDLPQTNIDTKATSFKPLRRSASWRSPNDCTLHPGTPLQPPPSLVQHVPPKHQSSNLAEESIQGFLKEVEELDLSVTEKRSEPTNSWIPQCAELDEILRENQQSDLRMEGVSPEVERLFSSSTIDLNSFQPALSRDCASNCSNKDPAKDELVDSIS